MTLRTVVSCVLLSFSSVAPSLAQASIKHPIDISQQQLGSALAELARRTHIQVVYTSDLVEGRRTTGLSGTMTSEEALAQLLSKNRLATMNSSTRRPSRCRAKAARELTPASPSVGENFPWRRRRRIAQRRSSCSKKSSSPRPSARSD